MKTYTWQSQMKLIAKKVISNLNETNITDIKIAIRHHKKTTAKKGAKNEK